MLQQIRLLQQVLLLQKVGLLLRQRKGANACGAGCSRRELLLLLLLLELLLQQMLLHQLLTNKLLLQQLLLGQVLLLLLQCSMSSFWCCFCCRCTKDNSLWQQRAR